MNKITYSQFKKLLAAAPGAKPVGLTALVETKARKNPIGTIFKSVRGVGFTGANYEHSINNEQVREGKDVGYHTEGLPWGKWVKGLEGKVIEHEGNFYLRTQTAPGQRNRQPEKLIGYRNSEGKFLKYEDVKPYLPVRKPSSKQEAAGLEDRNQIRIKVFKFSSLKRVRFGGRTFELVKD